MELRSNTQYGSRPSLDDEGRDETLLLPSSEDQADEELNAYTEKQQQKSHGVSWFRSIRFGPLPWIFVAVGAAVAGLSTWLILNQHPIPYSLSTSCQPLETTTPTERQRVIFRTSSVTHGLGDYVRASKDTIILGEMLSAQVRMWGEIFSPEHGTQNSDIWNNETRSAVEISGRICDATQLLPKDVQNRIVKSYCSGDSEIKRKSIEELEGIFEGCQAIHHFTDDNVVPWDLVCGEEKLRASIIGGPIGTCERKERVAVAHHRLGDLAWLDNVPDEWHKAPLFNETAAFVNTVHQRGLADKIIILAEGYNQTTFPGINEGVPYEIEPGGTAWETLHTACSADIFFGARSGFARIARTIGNQKTLVVIDLLEHTKIRKVGNPEIITLSKWLAL